MRTRSLESYRRVDRWKLIGLISILVCLIFILFTVENLFVSSLLAFILSYSVGPLVSTIERRGASRLLATSVTFALLSLAVGIIALITFPYITDTLLQLQTDLPKYIQGISQFLNRLQEDLAQFAGPYGGVDLTEKAQSHLTYWTQNFFDHLPEFLKKFVTIMLLTPFIAFFMVKDGRKIFRDLLNLAPNHAFETVLNLQHQISLQLGQFIRARMLEAIIVSLVTTLGLLYLNFPYALLLGIFAGVTNLIPYLGPIIGLIPALFFAIASGMTSVQILSVLLVYLIAQIIDAALLIPFMLAKIVDLHPVTVIVVIIAGAQVMGVLGMIISIPVASTLKVTIGTIYRHLTDNRT